ncbi:acyl-CoA thioesterase [Amycolatopsis sp. cmx-11-51]|uniref:acyl-CoA thioesterase n=1 Tax=unclassified Amycolatopsis TaxID=2618356 RepID=UPI0039E457C0
MSYISLIRPRWSDMDVYGHVNHANMVTLLEEARIPLLFGDAVRAGLTELPKGIVVVKLAVHYRSPIVVSDQDIRVEISLKDLKHASFTLGYQVHAGPAEVDKVAVTAETVLAPFDTGSERPRRLTEDERAFLEKGFADA